LFGILLVVALPNGVQTIYVCYNYIHFVSLYTTFVANLSTTKLLHLIIFPKV
jgi:hypothetical protein